MTDIMFRPSHIEIKLYYEIRKNAESIYLEGSNWFDYFSDWFWTFLVLI